eukprot:9466155-Alexandrium_andersonii.AAC.1
MTETTQRTNHSLLSSDGWGMAVATVSVQSESASDKKKATKRWRRSGAAKILSVGPSDPGGRVFECTASAPQSSSNHWPPAAGGRPGPAWPRVPHMRMMPARWRGVIRRGCPNAPRCLCNDCVWMPCKQALLMPPLGRPSKSPPPCEPGCEVSQSSSRPWARCEGESSLRLNAEQRGGYTTFVSYRRRGHERIGPRSSLRQLALPGLSDHCCSNNRDNRLSCYVQ